MDPHSYMKELLIDKIINEAIFKYAFNRNIISFNYVILNKQLGYFLKEKYNENRIELSAKKSNIDGLSGLDKLEMNSSKVDESAVVLSEINIKNTVRVSMYLYNNFNDVDKLINVLKQSDNIFRIVSS